MNFKYFCFAVICLLFFNTLTLAEDLEFESFEAAEKAAQVRSSEYDKKMKDHLKEVEDNWEKQQNDIGENETPDVSKISENSSSTSTSDNEAAKSMNTAVNDSINKLKNTMINQATPGSTGFAGGAAGYQWSIKFKDGKYVLSDSYSEADFNTGKEKAASTAATPPTTPTTVVTPDAPSSTGSTDNTKVAGVPTPTSAPVSSTPASTRVADDTEKSSDSPSPSPAKGSTGSSSPAKPEESPSKASKPKLDIAPTQLPPPAVRMVIQHPTDFSEEIFSSNLNGSSPTSYKLKKFKIPEDTRIKIAVELDESINPQDVSLVITDEEGERAPVTSSKMKNYRHMFRVPSEDKYSAKVVYKDSNTSAGSRKLMEVNIPVIKVDFDSRTIDSKGSTQRSGNDASMQLSSSAGTSNSSGNYKHSTFGNSEQVDLSDLYSKPENSTSYNQNNQSQASTNDGQTGSAHSNSGSQQAVNENSGFSSNSGSNSNLDSGSYGSQSNYGSNNNNPNNENSSYNSSNYGKSYENGINQNTNSNVSSSKISNNSQDYETGNDSTADNNNSQADHENGAYTDSNQNNGSYSSNNSEGDNFNHGSTNSSQVDSSSLQQNTSGNYDNNYDETSNSNGSSDSEYAMANNVSGSSSSAQQADVLTEDSDSENVKKNEENAFIAALSIQAPSESIYQSFNFMDNQTPSLGKITKNTELNFSLNFANNVDRNTVQIEIYDGISKNSGSLDKMGDSFAYKFIQPTENAYITITGSTTEKRFSYTLKVGVKGI